jgi:hypothetical protein
MKLDSVRELKANLAARVIARLYKPGALRLLSFSARRRGQVEPVQPTIALGVVRRGQNDFRLGVRIQRREMESSPALEAIREAAKGEIDERYVGRIVRQASPWRRRRHRPLRIGGSIGHHRITAGTLGCFVTSRPDRRVLILSNNHVLADESRAEIGDAILQPAPYDKGLRPRDVIGELAGFAKLKRLGTNRVDAAVCTVRDGVAYEAQRLRDLGLLAGLGDGFLDEGAAVAKIGRTTGLTRGRVTMFEADNVVVEYDLGPLRFDDQIEIESTGDGPFSSGGDSGSLIVSAALRGVGLLFAGGDQGGSNGLGLTYANPLRAVLESLQIELLY